MRQVAVFVDVLNLFYAAKYMQQSKVDYSKLLKGIAGDRQIFQANAYIIHKLDAKQEAFYGMLRAVGFQVKIKEVQQHADQQRKETHENWIAQITIDAMQAASNDCDIVLVTGDGNYADLAAHLKSTGAKVEVVGIEKTTSNKLMSAASSVTYMKPEWMFKETKFSDARPQPPVQRPQQNRTAPVRPTPNYDEEQPFVANQPTLNIR